MHCVMRKFSSTNCHLGVIKIVYKGFFIVFFYWIERKRSDLLLAVYDFLSFGWWSISAAAAVEVVVLEDAGTGE